MSCMTGNACPALGCANWLWTFCVFTLPAPFPQSSLGAWYLAVRGDGRASSATGSVLGVGVDGLPPLRGLPGGPNGSAYTQRDTSRDYTGRDFHLASGGRATVASAFPSRSGTARLSVVEPSFRSSGLRRSCILFVVGNALCVWVLQLPFPPPPAPLFTSPLCASVCPNI